MVRKSVLVAAMAASCIGSAHAAVFLSAAPTADMSCSAGVCTPTAHDAVLNVSDLAGMLSAGDVTVKTDVSAKDIFVRAALSWTSANRLTLDSYRSIAVQSPVVVAGPGALTLTTDDGGRNGVLSFARKGKADFWDLSSGLVVNGQSFALVGDLAALATAVATDASGAYALAADVDAATPYGASPVPTTFTGTFEGLGHHILHLQIHDTATGLKDGLFSVIGTGGAVRDLTLDKAKIYGGTWAGALAGGNYGSVARVTASGLVKAGIDHGFHALGGIVGWNRGGSMSDCHAAVEISGAVNLRAGGLAGISGDPDHPGTGAIADSSASGAVSAGNLSRAGGLVGENNHAAILRSRASGPVQAGKYSLTGGLAGENQGVIDVSFATGAVSADGHSSAGGLAGDSTSDGTGLDVIVRNSYATGSATAGTNAAAVGSVLGESGFYPHSLVQNAYGTGAVSGGNHDWRGGFVGLLGDTPDFDHAYWVTDTTGITDPSQGAGSLPNAPGIVAQTTGQLQSGLPTGFDPAIWGQSATVNGGYPFLLANPPE